MPFQGWYWGMQFRSLLELSFMKYFDSPAAGGERVIWGHTAFYEPHRIPYRIGANGKFRTYIPDFQFFNDVIEIKPSKRVNERKNLAKFAAARAFCKGLKMGFRVLTEKDLPDGKLLRLIDVIDDPGIVWSEKTKRSRAFKRATKEKR